MANFHTDYLVITANDQDMRKVLLRMAENLVAHADLMAKWNADLDLNHLQTLESPQDVFDEIQVYLEGLYMESFVGAPLPADIDDSTPIGWESDTSSARGFLQQTAALQKTLEQVDLPGNLGLGSFKIAPTGRGISETASVGLERYASTWAFTMLYSTAWEPNTDDLDLFFLGLPSGTYGVAFFDADEGDEYETISTFYGPHHGHACMKDDDGGEGDLVTIEELLDDLAEYKEKPLSSLVDDLPVLAVALAVLNWPEYPYEENAIGEDVSVNSPYLSSNDWVKPEPYRLHLIDREILNFLSRLPLNMAITGSAYEGRELNVEQLVAGDPVFFKPNWDTPYFTPVGIAVLDKDGRPLGNLDSLSSVFILRQVIGLISWSGHKRV